MKLFILLFIFFLAKVHSHQVCINLSSATPQTNNYCSDYNGFSCCSSAKDDSIRNLVNSLGITDQNCLNFIKKTSCSVCDSWGAHLFGVEDNNPSKFPDLCGGYCASFYQACSKIPMNWNGQNPFNTNENVIANAYPTQASFCSAFAPSASNPGYCYSGAKFSPPAPPPPAQGSPILCLEYFAQSSGALPQMAIKMVDLRDGSDRLMLGYHSGRIVMLRRSTGAYISDVITLPASVDGEAGFHGLAVHPNFPNNKKFYVYYSSKSRAAECQDNDWCNGNQCVNGRCQNYLTNVLEELVLDGNNGRVIRTLFTLSKPFPIHNGGDLTFGKDGKLYIPTGDGGSFNDPYNNAQNINRRTGKILRIDVDAPNLPGRNYGVPGDNPFLNSKFPEIYALGLRNPWRLSVDRSNGRMFVGDVGQDNVEEVDIVSRAANYGWPKYEGNIVNPTRNVPGDVNPRVNPIITFTHNQGGTDSSVTGGFVYRGRRDQCKVGKYIFANWNSNLYYANDNGNGAYSFNIGQKLSYRCASGSTCRSVNNVASFSEDDNGDLYILGTGGVFRIVEPGRCNIGCSGGNPTPTSAKPPGTSTTQNPPKTSQSVPTPSQTSPSTCSKNCGSEPCCKDARIGDVCYNRNTHSCVNDEKDTKLHLCPNGTKSCFGVCYNPTQYQCTDNGIKPM
eukprot:TRINITY_DN359_c1_g1_i1.p1 TRINITY_DN359_c1_g1~~TRINITY_DN359_c1_g1_i1.p1  ORF type:complete len:673 (+),score=193.52 TRINITY_DN359_c1_g1_i1:330-2348(+)